VELLAPAQVRDTALLSYLNSLKSLTSVFLLQLAEMEGEHNNLEALIEQMEDETR